MSAKPEINEKNNNFYSAKINEEETHSSSKKVNLNDLVARLHEEKAKEKKSNIILSVSAVSAVAVFGIILTL
jgi:hypothetical protein